MSNVPKHRPHSLEWKDDYDAIPTSNITHIQVDNMAFALNLRRSDAAPPLIGPGKDRIALLERARQMREKAAKEKGSRHSSLSSSAVGQLVKDNGCKSSICKQVVVDIFNTHEDTQQMNQQMRIIIESLKDDSEILAQLSTEYDGIAEVQQTLLKSLSKLDVEIDILQRKEQEKKDDQKEIELQIMEANELIRQLKSKDSSNSDEKKALSDEEVDIKVTAKGNGAKRIVRRHNGQYSMFDGKWQWSCCMAQRESARGCIDDESVGGMSALAQMKNAFANQTKVAPLQAHNYRETSHHHFIRYPMNSTNNLQFTFASDMHATQTGTTNANPLQSSLKVGGSIPPNPNLMKSEQSHHHTVSIDLPPKPTRRPQTATIGNRSSSPQLQQASFSFAPQSSFFTSSSAVSHDTATSTKIKQRPQTAAATTAWQRSMDNPLSTYGNQQVSVAADSHNIPKPRPKSAIGHQKHSLHNHNHHCHHDHHHHYDHHHHHNSQSHLHDSSRVQSQGHMQSMHSQTSLNSSSSMWNIAPKILPENSLFSSFRDHKVGKIRTVQTSEKKLPGRNRPMSSPAGYALYRDYQKQNHHPDLLPQSLNASASILELAGYSKT